LLTLRGRAGATAEVQERHVPEPGGQERGVPELPGSEP
jgi:hypothetical protein